MIANDIYELVPMALERSGESRNRLVERVANLMVDNGRFFTDTEQGLIRDILAKLIREVEQPIRASLAQILADTPNAPQEVVFQLANEQIEIAAPILMKSGVLKDNELLTIIHRQTERHHLAIAMRRRLSQEVSSALIGTQSEIVVHTVLGNEGAELSRETLEYLVDQSRIHVGYQEPLLHRRDLPNDLAEKMYDWVSVALKTYILEHYTINERVLGQAIDKAINHQRAQLDLTPEISSAMRAARLLAERGDLNGRAMLQCLQEAEIELFEAMFAELTALPLSLVQKVLYEDGGQGITLCASAMYLTRAEFTTLFLTLEMNSRHRVRTKPLTAWLKLFDRLNPRLARRALGRWARHVG